MDLVDRCDELDVAAPPAILFALYPSIAVFRLVRGFGLSLTLVFIEDCTNGLLTEGVACREVEQLPRRPRFAASEFVNECFVGRARDEHSDHVRIHDVGKLIVLLRKKQQMYSCKVSPAFCL